MRHTSGSHSAGRGVMLGVMLGVTLAVGDSDGDKLGLGDGASKIGSASQQNVCSLQPHTSGGWHSSSSHGSCVLKHGFCMHVPNSSCGGLRTHAQSQNGNACWQSALAKHSMGSHGGGMVEGVTLCDGLSDGLGDSLGVVLGDSDGREVLSCGSQHCVCPLHRHVTFGATAQSSTRQLSCVKHGFGPQKPNGSCGSSCTHAQSQAGNTC